VCRRLRYHRAPRFRRTLCHSRRRCRHHPGGTASGYRFHCRGPDPRCRGGHRRRPDRCGSPVRRRGGGAGRIELGALQRDDAGGYPRALRPAERDVRDAVPHGGILPRGRAAGARSREDRAQLRVLLARLARRHRAVPPAGGLRPALLRQLRRSRPLRRARSGQRAALDLPRRDGRGVDAAHRGARARGGSDRRQRHAQLPARGRTGARSR